MIIDIV